MHQVPHPKDPLLMVPAKLAQEEASSVYELIPRSLKDRVRIIDLEWVIDTFTLNGDHSDYHLEEYAKRLPQDLFPPELVARFMQTTKGSQTAQDQSLPAVLLYRFLWPYFFRTSDYPNEAKEKKAEPRVIRIPAGQHKKFEKSKWLHDAAFANLYRLEIDEINWPRGRKDKFRSQIEEWLKETYPEEGHKIFFRATSWHRAIHDMEFGMNEASRINGLFEFGFGAYFASSLEYALNWMNKYDPKGPGKSLTVYRVPDDILETLPATIYEDQRKWEALVSDQLKGFHGVYDEAIYGFSASNTIDICDCATPKVQKTKGGQECLQLCLKTSAMCMTFLEAAQIIVIYFYGGGSQDNE